ARVRGPAAGHRRAGADDPRAERVSGLLLVSRGVFAFGAVQKGLEAALCDVVRISHRLAAAMGGAAAGGGRFRLGLLPFLADLVEVDDIAHADLHRMKPPLVASIS